MDKNTELSNDNIQDKNERLDLRAIINGNIECDIEQIREDNYREKILTPYFQVDIIELKKAIKEYETNSSDRILQWMKFLNDAEDMEVVNIMKENKNIKEAKDEFDLISKDDTLRWLALRAGMAKSEEAQLLEDAKERGLEEGKKEIAKKLLERGLELSEIIEITGLTEEEISKL